MAQSTEYPDLRFMPPRAYGRGRDGKAVRYIVVHYTAGAERSTSAEDGAAYDQRRADGTSTHYFVDSDSVVQCVLTTDRANACFGKGNRLGVQYELCGTQQTRAQWLDPASDATLTNAARQIARDCRRYGIPVRRLSVAETRAAWYQFPGGPKGIVGHCDVTRAYPEDGGTHLDPGEAFPWEVLLDRVGQFLGQPYSSTAAEGAYDMATIPQDQWNTMSFTVVGAPNGPSHVRDALVLQEIQAVRAELAALAGRPAPTMPITLTDEQITRLAALLAEADNDLPADPEAIAAAVRRAIAEAAPEAVKQALREGTSAPASG